MMMWENLTQEDDIMKKISIHWSTVFIMLGILVSFFAFLNGMDLFQSVKAALNEASEFRYKNEITVNISGYSQNADMIKELEKIQGNIMFQDYLVYLDRQKVYHLTDIVLQQEEEFLYPLIEGRYPDMESSNKEVTIGRGMESYCFVENGKRYIEIEGEEYLVVGIIGSEISDIMNGKIIMNYYSLSEIFQNRILQQDVWNLQCASNQQDLEPNVMNFYVMCMEQGATCSYQVLDQTHTVNVEAASWDSGFYLAIYVFAMINCIVVSEFWILRRKQEMLVRKIWGYTNVRLFFLMLKELLCISCGAVCIGWGMQMIAVGLFGDEFGIKLDVGKLGISMAFIFITALIIVLVPTYKVSHEFPCANLEV